MSQPENPDFGQQVKKLFDLCADKPKSEQQTLLANSELSEDVIKRVKNLLNYSDNDQLDLTKVIVQESQTNQALQPLQPQLNIDVQTRSGDQIPQASLYRQGLIQVPQ